MTAAAEAYKRLWDRLYNPRSMCPDVELGRIQEVMTQILAEEDTNPISSKAKEVLAHITLAPRTLEQLRYWWIDTHTEDQYHLDSEEYDELVHQLRLEIDKLVDELRDLTITIDEVVACKGE